MISCNDSPPHPADEPSPSGLSSGVRVKPESSVDWGLCLAGYSRDKFSEPIDAVADFEEATQQAQERLR